MRRLSPFGQSDLGGVQRRAGGHGEVKVAAAAPPPPQRPAWQFRGRIPVTAGAHGPGSPPQADADGLDVHVAQPTLRGGFCLQKLGGVNSPGPATGHPAPPESRMSIDRRPPRPAGPHKVSLR